MDMLDVPEIEGLLFVVGNNLMDNRSIFSKFCGKLDIPRHMILRSYKSFLYDILEVSNFYSLDTYLTTKLSRPYILRLEPSRERVSFRVDTLKSQCLKSVLNNLDHLQNCELLAYLQNPTFNRQQFKIQSKGPWHCKFEKYKQTAWEIVTYKKTKLSSFIRLQVDSSEENFKIIKESDEDFSKLYPYKMIYFMNNTPRFTYCP